MIPGIARTTKRRDLVRLVMARRRMETKKMAVYFMCKRRLADRRRSGPVMFRIPALCSTPAITGTDGLRRPHPTPPQTFGSTVNPQVRNGDHHPDQPKYLQASLGEGRLII